VPLNLPSIPLAPSCFPTLFSLPTPLPSPARHVPTQVEALAMVYFEDASSEYQLLKKFAHKNITKIRNHIFRNHIFYNIVVITLIIILL
jgi:hypothetical protein